MYITCIPCTALYPKKKEKQKNQNGCVSLSERFIELVYVCTRCDECNLPYRTPYVPYYTV